MIFSCEVVKVGCLGTDPAFASLMNLISTLDRHPIENILFLPDTRHKIDSFSDTRSVIELPLS